MKSTTIWATKAFSVVSFILLLIAVTLSLSQPVYAAAITVTTTNDVLDADAVVDPMDCTPLTVSNLNSSPGEDGLISLREAICAANNTAGPDTISLPAGTYRLSIPGVGEEFNAEGDLDITDDLTITGEDSDARNTIIQAGTDETNGIDRVFHIPNGATVTMEKITVRYGRVSSHGAGIYVEDGTLTVTDSNIKNNNATGSNTYRGGGIRVLAGSLTLNNSTVSDNTAQGNGGGIQIENAAATLTINSSTVSTNTTSSNSGGGIYMNNGISEINNSTIGSNTSHNHGGGIFVNNGTLTLNNSTVTDNEVTNGSQQGGGIRVSAGALTLNNSTVSNNTAPGNGGGIQFQNGTLTINSSTTSNNTTSSGSGGGIYISGGNGKINNSTIASNTSSGSGGGLYVIAGTSQIKNTIIADNDSTGEDDKDCRVFNNALTSEGYNLVEVTTSDCTIFTGTGDLATNSPFALVALANNGGPTNTHAIPDDTSPAVDAGHGATCEDIDGSTVSQDQRGTTRAIDGDGAGGPVCDIGAYEFGAPTVVSLANFGAMTSRDHVVVTWDTVSESDNLGFHVYRSTTDQRAETPLNEVMISSQAPGSGQGSSYTYQDYDIVAGTTYYYWLADLNVNHVETYHGPVTVTYDYIPTAIRISTLDSNKNNVPLVGLAALLAVTLMAGGMLMQRDS